MLASQLMTYLHPETLGVAGICTGIFRSDIGIAAGGTCGCLAAGAGFGITFAAYFTTGSAAGRESPAVSF